MIRGQPGVAEGTGRPLAEPDGVEEDSSDEDEVLEESPCGRWQKRKDEVCSRWILPGTDLSA